MHTNGPPHNKVSEVFAASHKRQTLHEDPRFVYSKGWCQHHRLRGVSTALASATPPVTLAAAIAASQTSAPSATAAATLPPPASPMVQVQFTTAHFFLISWVTCHPM